MQTVARWRGAGWLHASSRIGIKPPFLSERQRESGLPGPELGAFTRAYLLETDDPVWTLEGWTGSTRKTVTVEVFRFNRYLVNKLRSHESHEL